MAADWIPYKKHFRRTGVLDLKAWCLDAWMLAGLKGFEEVADRWEEGIGRTEDIEDVPHARRSRRSADYGAGTYFYNTC